MTRHPLIPVVLSVALGACAGITVNTGNPRPNINIAKSEQKMKLELGTDVRDTFKQPGTNNMAEFEVKGWHGTLKNGFKNGFGKFFTLVDDGQELSLQVETAELSFVPAAVAADGNTAAVRAQVRFSANLVDPTGNVVKRMAGTAESKQSTGDRGETGRIADGAVESMYEAIAAEAFATK
ncbi:MAG: hypothetical protein HY904_05075 [Deltaproteobacteria bacterium]|nr:hypothetical protein [Deltaproteobacteria bacterium]